MAQQGLGRLARLAAIGAALLLAIGLPQWLRHRPDPAAEDGVRIAAVLLLEADARIAALPASADAGQRAQRAALVRSTWDDQSQAARLAAAEQQDAASAEPSGRTEPTGPPVDPGTPVYFVVTRWDDVSARARRAQAVVVGHHSRWRDGVRRDDADRTWRVERARIAPVGRTRGWRLVSVG